MPAAHRIGVQSLAADAWTFENFRRELGAPHVHMHVVDVQATGVVAYSLVWLIGDEGEIVQVATAPNWRCRGFARALLRRVLSELKAEGMRTCHLEVRGSRTAARALYEGLGFRVHGVRKGYYRDPREDALRMTWNA